MRLVVCLLAAVVAAGSGLAGTPLAQAAPADPLEEVAGPAGTVLATADAPGDHVADLTGLPPEAPAVDGLAGTGVETVEHVLPGAVPDLGIAVDAGAGVDVGQGVREGAGSQETAPDVPPVQAAAPIAAVGSAAAAWHLRFVPWRRLGSVAWKLVAAVPLLPALGMFSRIEDDALKDHPVRARILQVLEERPGASIIELQEETDVAWGTVVYHLGRLSQARHIVSQKDGRNHRFWTESDPEARNRKAAFVLKRATPAAIAATVRAEPGIHQGALCDRLEIRPATASKYLKRLAQEGLVSVTARAQRRHYYPTPSLEAMGRSEVQQVRIRFGPRDATAMPAAEVMR